MEPRQDQKPAAPAGLELLTTRMQYYEQELMRSISAIVKNVSEYFQLANGTSVGASANDSDSALTNLSSFFMPSSSIYLSSNANGTADDEGPEVEPVSQAGFGSAFGSVSWDDVLAQLILLVSLTFVLWVLNRRFLRWTTLTMVTEVVLSWALVLATSPIAFLFFGPILITRACVQVYLRLCIGLKDRIFLADPFETVWSFEAPNSSSTCVGLQVIEGDGNLERIQSEMHRRVVLRQVDGVFVNDCFRRVLRKVAGFVAWERVQHFDITNHVRYISDRMHPDHVWTEQNVFEDLAARQETSLCDLHVELGLPDPIPPWEFLVIPRLRLAHGDETRSCYGIAYRVHHAMMDGISLGNILHDCIADKPFKFSVDPCAPSLRAPFLTRALGHILSLVALPRITFKNLFFFERNAFHGRSLTGPKTFGWSRPLRLDALKTVKNLTKTSVMAVLLSCVGGSLKRLYEKRADGKVPELVHACPPVAILPYPDRYPRNRFSIVLYPVLLKAKTALDRLAHVYRESNSLATSPDVLSNYYVVYVLGLLPYPVLKVLAPLAHATFTFSNIPGPAESVQVLGGDKLLEIGAWIPIKNRIGIGAAVFSYQDRLRVSFIADKATLAEPDDLQLLCDGFEDEIADLTLSLQLKCDKLFFDE